MRYSAFPSDGRWMRGNLHSHTTLSDGLVEPAQQAADYRAMGYDFLSVTDHNVMHKLTELNCDGFLMLPGWERDIPYGTTKCLHVVGQFPADYPEDSFRRPKGDPEKMSMQHLLDEMNGENDFITLAHPVWSRMEPEEIRALTGYHAIEVFNTGTERLCHAGRADILWDMLLRDGRHVFCVACDDTHGKTAKPDRFGGWVMVKAKTLSVADLLRALRAGPYYATQGPELHEFAIEDGNVMIDCSPCEEVHIVTWPPRGRSIYNTEGSPLIHVECPLKGGERYVRVECVDAQGQTAWSQPLWSNGADEPAFAL